MSIVNTEQADYWQSEAGRKWVTHKDALDTLMANVLDAALSAARPGRGEDVLDIGCGTGASTARLSEMVDAHGHVTAIDISSTLLALARERVTAANVDFLHADAQSYEFTRQYDLLFSRFGVMFFDDPVAAFVNLRRAARPGARLAMICWQGMPANPWFQIPFMAAIDRLGRPSPLPENAPGPTAFKDIERVTGILSRAGWSDVAGTPVEVDLIPPQDVQDAADFAATLGPASRTLAEKGGTDEDRRAITKAIATALEGYRSDAGIAVPARLVIYTGRNPD